VTPSCHSVGMDITREPLIISCDTCVMVATSACDDCMMNCLVDTRHDGAVVLDFEEQKAVRLLAKAGLVPTLRHRATG